MKMYTRLLAAAAFVTSAAYSPALAQTQVSTNGSVFKASHSSLVTDTFPTFTNSQNNPYTQAGVTFTSSLRLFEGNDSAYNNANYLNAVANTFGQTVTLSFTSSSSAIDFNLGSYNGAQTISYLVNGVAGTLAVPGQPGTTFIGFDSGNPNTALSGSFTFVNELDLVSSFQTGVSNAVAAATPEPGTWAMMVVGFGLAGYALRRRQKVAARVSYAA